MIERADAVRREIPRDREQIVVTLSVDEGHLGALQCSLADAMREQRHFLTNVRADNQHAVRVLEILDGYAERREQRIARVVAEVSATQTMIEVRAAQATRDACEQMQFFQRGVRRSDRADLSPAMLLG